MRKRRWTMPEQPPPRRPYRDTAIFHLVLAALIVVTALLTGGSIGRSLVYAAGFFVVATAYSFWRWRVRLAEEAERASARAGSRSRAR
ncbi:MAG: hypothetical protein H0V40_06420 [Actinobacteria bacterium]|nr:hypothetical protein [Actinomycetota bacterium]